MTRERGIQLVQAAAYLLCFATVWTFGPSLEGTEFSGGRLTGLMLAMNDLGGALFLLAAVLAFFLRKTSAAMALISATLCLPLFVYFVAPGPFRWVFRGEYSVPLSSNFVWDSWSIAGIFAVVVASYFSVWSLLFSGRRMEQKLS